MSHGRIGRAFVASLHQAIAEELPTRLEFYGHWLSDAGLRQGTIGLAPMMAVLSFLRQEGPAYDRVVARAGRLAAGWYVDGLSRLRLLTVESTPRRLRGRAVARLARRLIRRIDSASSGRARFHRGEGQLTVRGSLFCDVRATGSHRLCGFYAAALEALLDRFQVEADARMSACRAAGDADCVITIAPRAIDPAPSA